MIRKKAKEGIYINELLRRYVGDREFEGYFVNKNNKSLTSSTASIFYENTTKRKLP